MTERPVLTPTADYPITISPTRVRDRRGAVVAAISVSGPIDRMGRRPGARWAADLTEAAAALTH